MRMTTEVEIREIITSETMLRNLVAEAIADDPSVIAAVASGANAVAEAARANITSSGPSEGWLARERGEVAQSIKVIATESRRTRVSIYAGTPTRVYLVTSPHAASTRWEFGTRRVPMTGFMHAALKQNGGR
jgi:hypothetical protein